jgi:hypothetical protein
MAHFAEILNSVVQRVIVVHNNELLVNGVETESKGAEFCKNLFGGKWVQTSYNGTIRKQYAGIGYTYDHIRNEFVQPQPFESWTLDENNDWQPPTPKPDGDYYWNEATQTWLPFERS